MIVVIKQAAADLAAERVAVHVPLCDVWGVWYCRIDGLDGVAAAAGGAGRRGGGDGLALVRV
jgi:hypothetical protein